MSRPHLFPKHTAVVVEELPPCDVCRDFNLDRPAYADASVPAWGGTWGNLCLDHFRDMACSLGLGKGQRLLLYDYAAEPPPEDHHDDT